MNTYDFYNPDRDHYAFEEYLQMVHSDQSNVRISAANDLGISGNSKALAPLIGLLQDANVEVKARSILALGLLGEQLHHRIDMKEVTKAVVENINDPDPYIRCRCVSALGRLGDKSVLDILINSLHDKNEGVRVCAADSIGWLKVTSTVAVDNLIQGLGDPNQLVRSSCIKALVLIGQPNVIFDHIVAMLKDSDPYVRQDAATALGNIQQPGAFNALFQYIQNETDIKPSLAAQALGKLGLQVFDALINKLSDNDPNIRYWTTIALGYVGDNRAMPYLEKIIEHDVGETRTRAKIVTAAKKAIKKIAEMNSEM